MNTELKYLKYIDNDIMPKSVPGRIYPIVYENRKIGRNEPCPCGSKKKYKKCCNTVYKDNRSYGREG